MILPLPLHSTYSFHYGTLPPRLLAARARELGYRALALTDKNSLNGYPSFLEALEGEGLRALAGVDLDYEGGSCLLLAKDEGGFSALTRLLTARAGCLARGREGERNEEGAQGEGARDSLLEEGTGRREGLALWLAAKGGGLIALSDDPLLLAFFRALPDRYALLRRSARPAWRGLLASGLPPVAGAELSFFAGADREIQRLLVAIGRGATIWDVTDSELAPASALLEAPELIEATYRDCPEALAGNAAVAEACRFSALFRGWRFPAWSTEHPGGQGLLRELVLEGARARLGELTDVVRARIDYELGIIGDKGFADYFLVVRDIVGRASRTCGRGSAAASIVSFALGITAVDPLRHDLYFERFLNPGRKDPPDIDVDFAWDERDALLAKVVEGYGEAHAARVANHVCFQARGALRETARALGLPDSEISERERRLSLEPRSAGEGSGASGLPGPGARGPLAQASDARRGEGEEDETWARVAALARSITGFPRNLGVHSGGLVVVPDELCDIVPLARSGGGIRIAVWDKEGIEAAGLVKIDLLGNRSLAVVRDARANVLANGGRVEEGEAVLEDGATLDLLARGDTMGVFYVESPAMRLLQKKTGRGDFAHLVIHSSMIRPAANRYINEYIDRLSGKEWQPLHPLLAGLLDESEGLMCYQEDVSKVAVALAGFSPAEADGMRKVLSKKDAVTRLDSFKTQFVRGARERGVDQACVEEVWAMIQSFAGYSFVKAHSASYALLSFQSAWLRAHWPAEFMAAVISNRGGYYSVLAYASECRRMGLLLLPPSVEESDLRCRGRGRELRFGLSLIAGLGEATARRIVEGRGRGGPYRDLEDFALRVAPDRDEAAALAGSGALDGLASRWEEGGLRRADRLMRLLVQTAKTEEASGGPPELFDRSGEGLRSSGKRGAGAGAGASGPLGLGGRERGLLEAELRLLGTTLEAHPLLLWPEALTSPRVLARDLSKHIGETIRLVGWPVTAKEVLAKGDQPMEFVSFEDETALIEAVLFPEVYRRYGGLLFEERPFFLSGRVCLDRGALTLELHSLSKVPGRGAGRRPERAFFGSFW